MKYFKKKFRGFFFKRNFKNFTRIIKYENKGQKGSNQSILITRLRLKYAKWRALTWPHHSQQERWSTGRPSRSAIGSKKPKRKHADPNPFSKSKTMTFREGIKRLNFFFYSFFFIFRKCSLSLFRKTTISGPLPPSPSPFAVVLRWLSDERETPNDKSRLLLSKSVRLFAQILFKNHESNF